MIGVDRELAEVGDLEGKPGVELRRLDLEQDEPPSLGEGRHAGVVVNNYLHRPLLPRLVEALEPDGVLIYETFARGNERHRRPRNPAFLLEPGELLRAVAGHLHVVAYEHGEVGETERAVVQRICAVRADTIDPARRRINP